MDLPVIVIGGGGHASVIIDALKAQRIPVLGFTDPDPDRPRILGVPRIGSDKAILGYEPEQVRLANGVGSVRSSSLRRKLYEQFTEIGYRFLCVIHPSAVLAADVLLGDGCQIMAGAVVQTGTRIGSNSIVNTRASVDHHCEIAHHVHVAPGSTLCGNVKVADGVHIGAGATVLQNIVLASQSVVAAGAVVVRDIPPGVTVAGVPARQAPQN